MKKYQKKFNIFKVILDKEDPIIVEVGAHYGEDSVRFTETFKNCTVYCFEPDPRNVKVFKKYVDSPQIHLFEYALSNEEGTAEFYQSFQDFKNDKVPDKYDWISAEDYKEYNINSSGASSLKKGYEHSLEETVTVKTKRFDNWMVENDLTAVDLLWIDVQGAEEEVIDGASTELRNVNFIWIEYGETMYDGGLSKMQTIALLSSKGFKVLKDFPSSTETGDLLFYNAVRNNE